MLGILITIAVALCGISIASKYNVAAARAL
jgi:hypothetical protein